MTNYRLTLTAFLLGEPWLPPRKQRRPTRLRLRPLLQRPRPPPGDTRSHPNRRRNAGARSRGRTCHRPQHHRYSRGNKSPPRSPQRHQHQSARPGDGVYLSSIFPVVVGNRVVIPSGVYVQGVVDSIVRPGRGRRRQKAQLNMHFTP